MNPDKPHDKFFKEAFSRIDITSDFLQAYLPESIRGKLDLTSLRRETDSYTDEQLTEHFADLVFSGLFGDQPVKITLLLEHKSYTENHPHFQLNRYMLNVWEQQLKQKTALTPILPIILYHGKSRWQKRPLTAYFPKLAPELNPFLPNFDYVLIDLTTIEMTLPQLHSDFARLTGLLLQYSRRKRELIRVLESHAQIIQNVVAFPTGQSFIETTFIYLNWSSSLTTSEVIAIFSRISTQAGTIAMSAAQKLINEGIEKGIEQGIEQGIEKGIRGMLKLGMDAITIAAAFELPPKEVNQLIERIRAEKS